MQKSMGWRVVFDAWMVMDAEGPKQAVVCGPVVVVAAAVDVGSHQNLQTVCHWTVDGA